MRGLICFLNELEHQMLSWSSMLFYLVVIHPKSGLGASLNQILVLLFHSTHSLTHGLFAIDSQMRATGFFCHEILLIKYVLKNSCHSHYLILLTRFHKRTDESDFIPCIRL